MGFVYVTHASNINTLTGTQSVCRSLQCSPLGKYVVMVVTLCISRRRRILLSTTSAGVRDVLGERRQRAGGASAHWPGNGCTDPYQFVTSLVVLNKTASHRPGLLSSDLVSISMEKDCSGSIDNYRGEGGGSRPEGDIALVITKAGDTLIRRTADYGGGVDVKIVGLCEEIQVVRGQVATFQLLMKHNSGGQCRISYIEHDLPIPLESISQSSKVRSPPPSIL